MIDLPAKGRLAALALAISACKGSRGYPADAPVKHDPNAGGIDGYDGPIGAPTAGQAFAPGASGKLVQAWDWNGVVGTGQSLAVGDRAREVTLTTQSFGNLKLSLGGANISLPPYDSGDPALSVVPLVEPIRPEASRFPSAYPLNIYGETPHTAMGGQISTLYRRDSAGDYITVHTVVGESGQGIHVIDKTAATTPTTGHAFAATLFEVSALTRLARESGKTYGVAAIVLTHGETDGANHGYEGDVIRLYRDYSEGIRAITGQHGTVPLLLTQQQTCPGNNSAAASLLAQWRLGVDYRGEVTCAGPKYQYPYARDGLHMTADGYDRLGEKYGEVYYERVVLGHDWQPLQPVSVARTGAVITVDFNVPVPPLVWDETLPAPHQVAHIPWARGRGFEVENEDGEQTIVSASIRGRAVLIALDKAPDPANLVVRYAVTQDAEGLHGGQSVGRIGQLRDSDPLVGFATKAPQYNYAVSFELPIGSAPR